MSKSKSPRPRRYDKDANPFWAGAERRRATAAFQSQVTGTKIKLYMLGDGEDATDLLAALMVVIGTPCEAGARMVQEGQDRPAWVRQLHGALRTITTMCTQNGYRWQSQYAPSLERAIDVATENTCQLSPAVFQATWIEANGAAAQILNHALTADAIA